MKNEITLNCKNTSPKKQRTRLSVQQNIKIIDKSESTEQTVIYIT